MRPKEPVGVLSHFVGFSADGRWLVSSTASEAGLIYYHFWRAGTWEPGPRIDPEPNGSPCYPPAFTSDGQLMALGIAPDQVLLADAATGRELARLTTLQPVAPTPMVFSPDGAKLIARTNQKAVLVWDLRQIRDQLGILGLDWERRPIPRPRNCRTRWSAAPAEGGTSHRRSHRSPGAARRQAGRDEPPPHGHAGRSEALIHRGWLFTQQKKWPEAIADFEHLIRGRPGDSDASWLLAEAYLESGKPAGALAALNRLLERAPEDHDARFQRGLVALALAQPALAADDFSRVLAHEPDRDVRATAGRRL